MPAPDNQDSPDDPRDDEPGESSGGSFGLMIVAVIVSAIAILGFIGGLLAVTATGAPSGTPMCSTTCLGVVRLECPGNRLIGGCFGISVCDAPTHTCGVDPP